MNRFVDGSLRILWYHRRSIVWIATATVLATVLFSLVWLHARPFYTATTTVTMLPSDSEIGFMMWRSDLAGISPAVVQTQTQTEFLRSHLIARQVVEKIMADYQAAEREMSLAVFINDYIVRPTIKFAYQVYYYLNFGTFVEPPRIVRLTSQLVRSTEVENIPGSYIVKISVTLPNPVLAKRACNLLAETYVEETKRQNQEAIAATAVFIERQLERYKDSLLALEREVADLKKHKLKTSYVEEAPVMETELSQLLQEKNRLEVTTVELETQLNDFGRFRSQAEKNNLEARLKSAKESLWSVKVRIANQKQKMATLPAYQYLLFEKEQRKIEAEQNIAAMQEKLIQTKISQAGILGAIRIIDPATAPLYPSQPRVLINGIVAVFVGLLLALGFVIVKEAQMPRIHVAADVQSSRLSPLGVVPKDYGRLTGISRLTHRHAAAPATIRKHIYVIADKLAEPGVCSVVLFDTIDAGTEGSALVDEFVRNWTGRPDRLLVVNLDPAAKPASPDTADTPREDGDGEKRLMHVSESVDWCEWRPADSRPLLRADMGHLGSWLDECRRHYGLIIILAEATRTSAVAESLPSVVDKVVLVLRAHQHTSRDIEYYTGRRTDTTKPLYYCISDVAYPRDYVLR